MAADPTQHARGTEAAELRRHAGISKHTARVRSPQPRPHALRAPLAPGVQQLRVEAEGQTRASLPRPARGSLLQQQRESAPTGLVPFWLWFKGRDVRARACSKSEILWREAHAWVLVLVWVWVLVLVCVCVCVCGCGYGCG